MEPSYMIEKAELFTFENSYTIPFDMSGNKDKKGYKSIQLLPVDPNDYPGKEMTDRERTLFKGRLNSKLFAIFGKCAGNGGIDKIYCAELIRGIYWRNKFYGLQYANHSHIEIEKSRQIDVFSEMLDGLFTTVDFLAIVRGVGATAESLFAAHRLNWAWKGYVASQKYEVARLNEHIKQLEDQLASRRAETLDVVRHALLARATLCAPKEWKERNLLRKLARWLKQEAWALRNPKDATEADKVDVEQSSTTQQ